MGLDMGLTKKITTDDDLGYWRKANQIRHWLKENVEDFNDNGETLLSKENIEDLLKTCKEVSLDHSKAEELLPCSSGFFFGSNDYDDYYFEQIEETIDMLSKVLKTTDWDNEQIYYWEWY